MSSLELKNVFKSYVERLHDALQETDETKLAELGNALMDCWKNGKRVFVCGNGGSAGNAMHIANDFLYGISKEYGNGLKITALSSNPSVVTCLANDEGYDNIYSYQLAVDAQPGDVLIVLSGSGNSQNILNVLKTAKEKDVRSFAILGFGGGKADALADVALTYSMKDMQISEDLQLILTHLIMQWMYANRNQKEDAK